MTKFLAYLSCSALINFDLTQPVYFLAQGTGLFMGMEVSLPEKVLMAEITGLQDNYGGKSLTSLKAFVRAIF